MLEQINQPICGNINRKINGKINEQITSCTRCNLHKGLPIGLTPVKGKGNLNAQILIVNSTISKESSYLQEPFGQQETLILRRVIKKSGLILANFYFTSAVKCYGEDIKSQHIQSCKLHLWNEIQAIKPKVIVLLGKPATKLLLKKQIGSNFNLEDVICKFYGVVFQDIIPACYIVPLYSIEYLANQGKEEFEKVETVFCGIKHILDLGLIAKE